MTERDWVLNSLRPELFDDDDRYKPDAGVGIEFENHGKKYVTIAKTPRRVIAKITSWVDIAPGAVHYYASLQVHDLNVKRLDDGGVCSLFCKEYPDEAKGFTHRCKVVADGDILHFSIMTGEREVVVKHGEKTELIRSREIAIRRLKEDFELYFGKGWKLDMMYVREEENDRM